ncbi:MAG: hypothetical protein WCE53_08640 [Candidatus Acidiferrum sp.]
MTIVRYGLEETGLAGDEAHLRQIGLESLAPGARDNLAQIGVEKKSGRSVSSTGKAVELTAHIYSFVFYNLESRRNARGCSPASNGGPE